MVLALVVTGLEVTLFLAFAHWRRTRRSSRVESRSRLASSHESVSPDERILAALEPSLAAVEARVTLVGCHRDDARPNASRRVHVTPRRCTAASRLMARHPSSPWTRRRPLFRD